MKGTHTVSEIAYALEKAQKEKSANTTTTKSDKSVAADVARGHYQYNIGIDFGTAFTKCVIRDTRQSRAPATLVRFKGNDTQPFFLPTVVRFDVATGAVALFDNPEAAGEYIPYLKMALYASLRGRRSDPWIDGVAHLWPDASFDELCERIETLVIFFLAGTIERSLAAIRERLPDFGAEGDICTVNMAVPVAHAQDIAVENAFRNCLGLAWKLAHESPKPNPTFDNYTAAIKRVKRNGIDHDFCFIYPEVSANVQSFLKSPARNRGTYLFVDVGAGTVDASVFLWPSEDPAKPLTYLAADVFRLGSSQVELRATGSAAAKLKEAFRLHKEGEAAQSEVQIDLEKELSIIAEIIRGELVEALPKTLNTARLKLERPGHPPIQWNQIRVLLGGGGCVSSLYTDAVHDSFGVWHLDPPTLDLPMPDGDLEWPLEIKDHENRVAFFRRISVAYGLSFDRGELDGHRYPDEIQEHPTKSEDVPSEPRPSAPSKDEC